MSIKVKTLDKAVSEAKRFIEAAAAVNRAERTDEYTKGDPLYRGGRYSAAAKRASMDLTRALADVRGGF